MKRTVWCLVFFFNWRGKGAFWSFFYLFPFNKHVLWNSVSVLELVWKYSFESHTRIGTDFYILYRLWSLCNFSFYYPCDLHSLWVSTCSTQIPLFVSYDWSSSLWILSLLIVHKFVQEIVDSVFRSVSLVDKWVNHEVLCSKKWSSSTFLKECV